MTAAKLHSHPFTPWRSLETRVGKRIPLSPNTLSALKLLVVAPLLALSLQPIAVLPLGRAGVLSLFGMFAVLDYLDGVVARAQHRATPFGRLLDRATDYPVLLMLGYFCLDALPQTALAFKLGTDLLLLVLYAMGKGSTRNRLRTTLSYATLFALLSVSQGWAPRLFSVGTVTTLLWLNVGLSSAVALRNLGILKRKRIADALSLANLACGGLSMVFASRGRLEVSLLLLTLGAALDGMDGAASRRWGGSRYGVLMDDIADGFSYGIAPGFAVYATLGGHSAAALGGVFAVFVVGRLVYFTLNKQTADPNYFSGAPSTLGGLIVLCSLILFREDPLLVGTMVGVACTLMVSFSTHYRHLGRALTRRRALLGAPAYVTLLLAGAALGGLQGAVAVVLVGNLAYGFAPTAVAFWRAIEARQAGT